MQQHSLASNVWTLNLDILGVARISCLGIRFFAANSVPQLHLCHVNTRNVQGHASPCQDVTASAKSRSFNSSGAAHVRAPVSLALPGKRSVSCPESKQRALHGVQVVKGQERRQLCSPSIPLNCGQNHFMVLLDLLRGTCQSGAASTNSLNPELSGCSEKHKPHPFKRGAQKQKQRGTQSAETCREIQSDAKRRAMHKHTHTHTEIQTHNSTHTHTHANTSTSAHTHTQIQTHNSTLAQTQAQAHTQSQQMHTHGKSHKHTHTIKQKHITHAQTTASKHTDKHTTTITHIHNAHTCCRSRKGKFRNREVLQAWAYCNQVSTPQ